jgi:hypothetical protein
MPRRFRPLGPPSRFPAAMSSRTPTARPYAHIALIKLRRGWRLVLPTTTMISCARVQAALRGRRMCFQPHSPRSFDARLCGRFAFTT